MRLLRLIAVFFSRWLPKQRNIIAVLAGNKKEFDYFKRYDYRGRYELRYIVRERSTIGIRFDAFILYGTWHDRVDAEELCDNLRIRLKEKAEEK